MMGAMGTRAAGRRGGGCRSDRGGSARSKKVARVWGWVEIWRGICAGGGSDAREWRDPIPFARLRVQSTRGTHRARRSAAERPASTRPRRARDDDVFCHRGRSPCFSILSSASDEIWTFSAVSTCGESPVAAWGAPPMPIIPPIRGIPCIVTSLLAPGDASLDCAPAVTHSSNGRSVFRDVDQTGLHSWGGARRFRLGTPARVPLSPSAARGHRDGRESMGPIGGPAGRGLTAPPMGQGMRKVRRAHPNRTRESSSGTHC